MKHESNRLVPASPLRGLSAVARPAAWLATAALAVLAGCGGESTVPLPVTDIGTGGDAAYNGPPAATPEVAAFKNQVWDPIVEEGGCQGCHFTGGQAPTFMRNDDINLAFEDARALLDQGSPELSRLSTKVGGGHNCWLASDQACADRMTAWIGLFAFEVAGGEGPSDGREIILTPPPIKDVGASKAFPSDPALYAATVQPLLVTYCSGCHATSAALAQSPYLGNADPVTSYEAAKARIDLNTPANSRLVLRLEDEFHNCWGDCVANGAEMQAAIEAFADQIDPTEVDPSLLTSKALTLFDGSLASGGSRVENNVIALYEFKSGQGNTAFDTSGVSPALDLTISGDFDWVGGFGIDLRSGKAQGSTTNSSKLHELITQTGEYSIEAWVVPANVTQEEARIVSYSAGVFQRNFTLSQTLYSYDAFNRSSVTDANGEPVLTTFADDEDLQATLQHVVVTYDALLGRRIYVNGVFTDDFDAGGGSLADWDDTYAFVLGNEVSNDRAFSGVIRLVAIHNRVLTQEQIQRNFDAGVGEKFFLLFNVADLVELPAAYVMFEVSRFDSYSYLFEEPRFISLDTSVIPDNIPLEGMRIGVNGGEPTVGQAYANLDVMLNTANYDPAEGQFLSTIGTIVALDQGPDADEFFLTFDRIGNNENVRTDDAALAPPPAVDGEETPDIGIRTFAEINATMEAVTGVDSQSESVRTTYDLIRQQLPTVDALGGFLSSQQIAVAQLAIEYCNTLVDDTGARGSYFPGFNFGEAPNAAFGNAAQRDLVIDPLLANMMGDGVGTQPVPADVRDELNALIDRLTTCGNACPADKTGTIVKAVCSSVLGSAVTLVQ
ncbi:MAG: LamG domain-containing protein [Pseudomonadota bacterium]